MKPSDYFLMAGLICAAQIHEIFAAVAALWLCGNAAYLTYLEIKKQN